VSSRVNAPLKEVDLELAIVLTDGQIAEEVAIDTNAVELPPDLEWAWLSFDLSRSDWTVAVSLQTPQEVGAERSGTEGVLCILVPAGLDLHGLLAEERVRAMLHQWYVQFQVAGSLPSEHQLAELRKSL